MGRKKEIEDSVLLDSLIRVFQTFGYEGANMNRIAEATGLGKASLYHRYPGGKEEMALAALERADTIFANHVLAPLSEAGSPISRVRRMSERMKKFYDDGRLSCLLDILSMGEVKALRGPIRKSIIGLHDALDGIAREAGATPAEAKKRAERAVIDIQGSLVWSRASGETKPFQRIVKNLPELLVGIEK